MNKLEKELDYIRRIYKTDYRNCPLIHMSKTSRNLQIRLYEYQRDILHNLNALVVHRNTSEDPPHTHDSFNIKNA